MKEAGYMLKKVKTIIICILSGFFVSSCGLEEVLTVEEPKTLTNNTDYSSSEPLKWYFGFKTAVDSGVNFIGTDVYYKIYNNYSTLNSERSSILSVNTNTNSSAAATRMIETYTYQPLGTSTATDNSVYFEKSVANRTVVFRLKTYYPSINDEESKKANDRYKQHACVGIKIGDTTTEYSYEKFIPFRNGNRKSFDFFDDDEDNKGGSRDVLPEEGDSDYKHSSSASETDVYYVQLFAVGVALNPETVTASYSLVLDLGSVPIRKKDL